MTNELTPECKKDILDYLKGEDWINEKLFSSNNELLKSYFTYSYKGDERYLETKWNEDTVKYDIYLIEVIGYTLIKHNITQVGVVESKDSDIVNIYNSITWDFKWYKMETK